MRVGLSVCIVCVLAASAPSAHQRAESTSSSRASSRSLTVQDYMDIQQLYSRYAQAIDSGERSGEAWADAFTSDGVFNKTTVGREQLATFVKNWHASGRGGRIQHWNSQLVLTPTADGANGTCYLMLVDRGTK